MFSSLFFFPRFIPRSLRSCLTSLLLTIAVSGVVGAETIQARAADQFVDSMGVNVHMESNTTPPYKNYTAINQMLKLLGMRHVRDEINHADPTFRFYDPKFVKEMQQIGGLGYSLCGLIEGGNDYPPTATLEVSGVIPMIKNLLPTIAAVEGPNEPDGGGFVYDGSGYPQGAIEESEDLWTIIRGSSDSTINSVPILGMSEASAPDFKKLAAITGTPFDDADTGTCTRIRAASWATGLARAALRIGISHSLRTGPAASRY
jgi:hypothetical protein